MSDLAYTIFFILFIIYSAVFVPMTVKKLTGTKEGAHIRATDYAIMVNDLASIKAKELTSADLRLHFQKWGKVSEVAVGRWYNGMYTDYNELAGLMQHQKEFQEEYDLKKR